MGSLGKSPRALVVPMQTEGHWSPYIHLLMEVGSTIVWKQMSVFLDAPGLEVPHRVFTMRDLNWPAEWKEMLRPASSRAKRTTGLLINTFSSLLQKRCPTGKVPCKIFGPLLLFPTLPSFETHVHEAAKQYVEWLDKKPKSSVVFIHLLRDQRGSGPIYWAGYGEALESFKKYSLDKCNFALIKGLYYYSCRLGI
ncbi:hypothetical protein R1flu_023822 [Riccia fluitans]|uniref:Uncharacterized protein n=1 Tax=Riccia fluitans TaxID=41844 RepID=A0ABD1XTL5_9MARC